MKKYGKTSYASYLEGTMDEGVERGYLKVHVEYKTGKGKEITSQINKKTWEVKKDCEVRLNQRSNSLVGSLTLAQGDKLIVAYSDAPVAFFVEMPGFSKRDPRHLTSHRFSSVSNVEWRQF